MHPLTLLSGKIARIIYLSIPETHVASGKIVPYGGVLTVKTAFKCKREGNSQFDKRNSVFDTIYIADLCTFAA